MIVNRKQLAEKERKQVFSKQIVTKNPIFTTEHCQDFFNMFNLYCDNRRQCDIADILNTAKTLGFDKKYKLIYKGLQEITEQLNGEWVNFELFLKKLTDKLGNPFSREGRRSMFNLVDFEKKQTLTFEDLKKISEMMKFNLGDQEIQEVVNNVAGFGKKQISWEQFDKYILKKVDKRASSL